MQEGAKGSGSLPHRILLDAIQLILQLFIFFFQESQPLRQIRILPLFPKIRILLLASILLPVFLFCHPLNLSLPAVPFPVYL